MKKVIVFMMAIALCASAATASVSYSSQCSKTNSSCCAGCKASSNCNGSATCKDDKSDSKECKKGDKKCKKADKKCKKADKKSNKTEKSTTKK